MPSKKRKYNARFPAGRIKRIMQADEEVGKIAQAVPIIISRTLELFVESLLTKSSQITMSRNAKTLSPTHLKQCIMSESRFDFLKDLVKNIPDIMTEENGGNGSEEQHATPNNGLESNNGAHHHRITLQRSQSLQQPSTSSSQQYNISPSSNRVQPKQFYLNNYTSIPTNNNNNFSSNQITKPNISTSAGAEFQHPPTKIFRLNSTPASATITSSASEQQQQQSLKKQSLAPLEFPIQISYNIDGTNNALSTDSPTVKIDYSKLALPATSPSIKIDLSHFNAQIASATSNSNASHQPFSNATTAMPTSSSASLDEDYDA